MLYNFKLFGRFLLFALFIISVFNGYIILKTGIFTHPFDRRKYIEGWQAKFAGMLLIILGLLSLFGLIFLPSSNIFV